MADSRINNGISNIGSFGFCLQPLYGSQRYSTNLFNMIILTSATGFDINLTLWFISPLIYIFIPFLFYSTFQKTSNNKANSKLNLIILTLFVILLPQFLKEGRNANTGLIGTIIFFILIKEFYDLINDREFKVKDFFLIFLLYYFLCLTRFEECIYFLVLIIFFVSS